MRRSVLLTMLATGLSLAVAATASATITETVVTTFRSVQENVSFLPTSCSKALPGFYTVIVEGRIVDHFTAKGVDEDNDPVAPHHSAHSVATIVLIPNDPTMPTYTARWVGGGVSFQGDGRGVTYMYTTIINERYEGSDGSSFTGVIRAHLVVDANGEVTVEHTLQECGF